MLHNIDDAKTCVLGPIFAPREENKAKSAASHERNHKNIEKILKSWL